MFSSQTKLESLLMDTGSVTKFVDVKTWTTLAGALKNVFHNYLLQKVPQEEKGSYTAELGTVFYSYRQARRIKYLARAKAFDYGENDGYLDAPAEQKIVNDAADFVKALMDGNGQWNYINEQDWFRSGQYLIAIDINYYPDRSGTFKEYPIFHKDTGGNNIFVNLVFDNETIIEATEWYTDLALPSSKQSKWQWKLLPKAHLDALGEARAALRNKAKQSSEPDEVKGGVSREMYTYVSWVDDLVWHATPISARRFTVDRKMALDMYPHLDAAHTDSKFKYTDDTLGSEIQGLEIVGTMSELAGPHLGEWMGKRWAIVQDIDRSIARRIWGEIYHGAKGKSNYEEDVAVRLGAMWRITGAVSAAIAKDSRLDGSKTLRVTPVGLSSRPRVNSDAAKQEELEEARTASAGRTRSFIRTWVRIIPKNSTELQGL
jgi:hypothetical protein